MTCLFFEHPLVPCTGVLGCPGYRLKMKLDFMVELARIRLLKSRPKPPSLTNLAPLFKKSHIARGLYLDLPTTSLVLALVSNCRMRSPWTTIVESPAGIFHIDHCITVYSIASNRKYQLLSLLSLPNDSNAGDAADPRLFVGAASRTIAGESAIVP